MMTFTSKFIAVGAGCLALGSLFSPVASATDLLNITDSIPTNSATEMGRVSRNGVQQTWDPADNGETAYPGSINPTATYNYVAYTFTAAQLGDGQYVQIDFEEPNGAADLFATAWTTFSGTASIASGAGFLGDAGSSRDFAFTSIPPTPQDPRFFNVTIPAGSNLTVVINTSAATGVGENYGLQVEAFSSKDYTDAILGAVPEPSTWAMLGAGIVVGGVMVQRRRRASV